jgi:hypothetical protein
MSRSEFEYDICQREYDGSWQVVAKLSSVRLGETERDNVRQKLRTDYMKWSVIFVSESEESCKKWVDSQWDNLVKLGIPYEVA